MSSAVPPPASPLQTARVVDLGSMPYQEAWDLQYRLQARQFTGELGPMILIVEHPHTVTIGRRGDSTEVVAPAAVLRGRGVAVIETDRGGQVTYHGPGQLVCYPMVNVEKLGLHEYMRLLEEAAIRTIAEWGIEGYRVEGRTGVWVGKEKIAAMGIRVRKWWTLHGLALNVTTDLNYFGLIIPCGIRDRGVTSMEHLLAPAPPPPMARIREQMVAHLGSLLNLDPQPGNLTELE